MCGIPLLGFVLNKKLFIYLIKFKWDSPNFEQSFFHVWRASLPHDISNGPCCEIKLRWRDEQPFPLCSVRKSGFRRMKGTVAMGPRFSHKPNTRAKNLAAQYFDSCDSGRHIHIMRRPVKLLSFSFKSSQPLRTDMRDWRVMTAQNQRK